MKCHHCTIRNDLLGWSLWFIGFLPVWEWFFWEMLFEACLYKSNFHPTFHQVNNVLWNHLELCTHSSYILSQKQLPFKKNNVISLTMFWTPWWNMLLVFPLLPFTPLIQDNVCMHKVHWLDLSTFAESSEVLKRCWKPHVGTDWQRLIVKLCVVLS